MDNWTFAVNGGNIDSWLKSLWWIDYSSQKGQLRQYIGHLKQLGLKAYLLALING